MRISDWSSDVCSSDLLAATTPQSGAEDLYADAVLFEIAAQDFGFDRIGSGVHGVHVGRLYGVRRRNGEFCCVDTRTGAARSEEHTSELQSLMRISYAVFCLKKKT